MESGSSGDPWSPVLEDADHFEMLLMGPWVEPPDDGRDEYMPDVVAELQLFPPSEDMQSTSGSSSSLTPTRSVGSSSTASSPVAPSPVSRRRIRGKQNNPPGFPNPDAVHESVVPVSPLLQVMPLMHEFAAADRETKNRVSARMRYRVRSVMEKWEKGQDILIGAVVHSSRDLCGTADGMEKVFKAWYTQLACDQLQPSLDRGWAMKQLDDMGGLSFEGDGINPNWRKCSSLLVTYNGTWGIVHGVEDVLTLDALQERLKHHDTVKELSDQIHAWLQGLKSSGKSSDFAWSLEICPKTWSGVGECRLHLHVWISMRKPGSMSLRDVNFHNTRPYMDEKSIMYFGGSSSRSKGAQFAGAFYCSVQKKGAVVQGATIAPFTDYLVKDWWITNLYISGKLEAGEAIKLYHRAISRAQFNVQQVRYSEAAIREADMAERMRSTEIAMRQQQRPFLRLDAVESWKLQYLEFKSRYKFLVLNGPTSTGKTRFARSMADIDAVYYCDCSSKDGIPDLRKFDFVKHKVIILDEISAKNAIAHKKLLQAGSDPCVMGMSPTMQHVYTVWAHCTKFVICTNTWGCLGDILDEEDVSWLRGNMVFVQVDEALFEPA